VKNNKKSSARKALSHEELLTFCAQLSMTVRAGIPPGEGIDLLCRDVERPGGRSILQAVRRNMGGGESLQSALLATGCFPKYMTDMVGMGEAAGNLGEVLGSLHRFYEEELEFRRVLKSIVLYPLVMAAMLLVVIGVLALKVMPIFDEVSLGLGLEMNAFSRGASRFGQALAGLGPAALAPVLLAGLPAALLLSPSGRRLAGRCHIRIFTKGFAAEIAASRFASVLFMTLSSGLTAGESLDIAYELADNGMIRGRIDDCRGRLGEGCGLSDALARSGLLSGLHAKIVAAGFQAGSPDKVMRQVSDELEKDVQNKINNFLSVLEPALVALLSLVTGALLLSVMLPLISITAAI